MIVQILKLLQTDNYYGISKEIEIAKGKNELPKSFQEIINQAKRKLKWQLRKP
ncbi:hypothetical protein [Galbibacter pacificus]|uniref:Uncharacterized protein n=1 Tax=Galbibacter pacificus TaxID=2996052 RepID=A0ABT6FQD3_9FLAO|nr:hypothetical protein [Galbibacter pacificus]MDG3582047.1 hypothetical protein [Galbibacter pacificus]MDG3585479.1 hypothetical protein [Galbibacter pacificus]